MPKNILIVAHDEAMYGAQRSLLDILRHLDRKKFTPTVVIPARGAFTKALSACGITHFSGMVRRWVFPPRCFQLGIMILRPWRLIRLRWDPRFQTWLSLLTLPLRLPVLAVLVWAKGIRMIYSNTITVLDGALVARLCRIPHVWHIRESITGNKDLECRWPADQVSRFVLRHSDIVITNSHALKRSLFGNDADAAVRVIHNGIVCEEFSRATPAPALAELSGSGPMIAICGALQERKDHMTFVRAAARLTKTWPNARFVIIGRAHGAYFDQVTEEVDRLGLRPQVHFLGFRDDIPELFAGIDILVSAAREEPFGRTIIEAMAAGKPVVATRSGGPEEIIDDGLNGYLVEIGDDTAMAKRLAELLADPTLMQSMGQQAKIKAMRDFDLTPVVNRIESIFEEVLDAANP
ncbi:MAG: glycosyltransferase family 4 protein [Rhodocyclaceae bacterium]|nr:glycosyltransferase family 4 protein [Rhodocyclaceae bacterium]MDZ4214768.1 glycosyltransferase family 4 protein [Rhodocyclaceae bacterium]